MGKIYQFNFQQKYCRVIFSVRMSTTFFVSRVVKTENRKKGPNVLGFKLKSVEFKRESQLRKALMKRKPKSNRIYEVKFMWIKFKNHFKILI